MFTANPLKVSFIITVPGIIVAIADDGNVTTGSFTAFITLATITVAVAVSQLAGITLNPVTTSASHNW